MEAEEEDSEDEVRDDEGGALPGGTQLEQGSVKSGEVSSSHVLVLGLGQDIKAGGGSGHG